MSRFGDLRFDWFASEYVRTLDLTIAADIAGLPHEDAAAYLASKKGQKAVRELMGRNQPGGELITQRIVSELLRVALGNVACVLDPEATAMVPLPRKEWPEHVVTLIASMGESDKGWTIKGHNKMQAMDMLLKIHGGYKSESDGSQNFTFIGGDVAGLTAAVAPALEALQRPRGEND